MQKPRFLNLGPYSVPKSRTDITMPAPHCAEQGYKPESEVVTRQVHPSRQNPREHGWSPGGIEQPKVHARLCPASPRFIPQRRAGKEEGCVLVSKSAVCSWRVSGCWPQTPSNETRNGGYAQLRFGRFQQQPVVCGLMGQVLPLSDHLRVWLGHHGGSGRF